MSLLSLTLGRIAPQYKTLREWSIIYDQIISSKQVLPKTLESHRLYVARILETFGTRALGSIRPYEIATLIRDIHARTPQTARRVLIEARCLFSEAVNYGWLDRNPALDVKHLRAPVVRQRLSLDQWQRTYEWAELHSPPWVSRMLLLALLTGQRRADLQKMGFDDVWDGYLHVEQQKTGARIALPLALRMDAVDCTLGHAIEMCRCYAAPGPTLLRKSTGAHLARAYMTARFEKTREAACGVAEVPRTAPSLHECRSLSERLYRAQGVDTRTLLGHKRQSMTDMYNDDRGLERGKWKVLTLPHAATEQPELKDEQPP